MWKIKQKSIENVAHNDLVFRLSAVIFGRDISPLRRYIFNSCIKFNSLRRKSNPCSFVHKLIIAFRSAASIKLFVFRGMLSVSSRIDLLRFLLSIHTIKYILLVEVQSCLMFNSTYQTSLFSNELLKLDIKKENNKMRFSQSSRIIVNCSETIECVQLRWIKPIKR